MVKPATVAAVWFSVPALALAACSPQQHASTVPGTLPPVWTGSTAPTAPTSAAPAGSQELKAQVVAPNGTPVANATFDFANGYATVTVETVGSGILTPGFHGMHIHAVGKCEANSVAPTGGAPGDFLSAGGHYQAPGHTAHPASGDLTSLQVRSDGAARLVTTTDAFTAADLLGGQKTAIIIHADPDNFGNLPPEKYQQVNGTPGPDQATLDTGDAGKRVACGVING
ncbi:superoxide dismutase[Cu-Zn] [Mycobacterium sp.]|uniref:superoxide dismutase[Cu-Zn] n=1 Tax=Mycobacterium sp. TaxID=1785 RepID=UPI002D064319|nr:superoxide dismutase family protein [Mycobacterium sp.]HME47116.1 superoxide dismutase family protein [Mycobacterium sp.]